MVPLVVRALLLAACLGAPAPAELGELEVGPGDGSTAVVRDESGTTVATVDVRPDHTARVHLEPGTYTVERAGETRTVEVASEPRSPAVQSDGVADDAEAAVGAASEARMPAVEPTDGPVSDPVGGPTDREGSKAAWRAPLMAAFVPGLGHAWAGKPGWGVAVFATTLGATVGAVSLALAGDPNDGATPSDTSRSAGYGRLGGVAAFSSLAGGLYIGQIFDAHRVERGIRLRPRLGRVELRFDRLSAVAMAPGRPRAALLDDFSLAALVRVSDRVRVGPSDASIKLGPEQTVLQLGARATAQLWGPDGAHPYRRWAVAAGGGILGQLTTQRRADELDPETTRQTERAGGVVPYVLAQGHLFVAPRWSVGALGRLGVPLTPRRYARGRALPAFAPTLELGVSLGVNL